jgi:hypothetical protein
LEKLEEELDRLYALEPGEFIAERDRLARELRGAGEREQAEQVKSLRKPTVAAWTINQLTRRERRHVDLLLDAGHRLREAQQRLLAGEDPGRLDEARRSDREALAALRKAARGLLDEAGRGSETTLNQIVETLGTAAVSIEGRELLARGRFTGELEATGFELLAPLTGAAPASRKRASTRQAQAPKSRRRPPDRKRVEQAQAEVREAQANLKAAERDVRTAEQAAAKALGEAEQAEELVQKQQAAAEKARTALERAEKQLGEARGKTR